MACPKCGCKTTYPYDDSWDGEPGYNDDMDSCAACGNVFYIEDHDEEEYEPEYLDIPNFLRRGND
jgi:hypothetical protein